MSMEEILIVDDEAPIRMALKAAFRKEGIEIAEAADGVQALEMLKREKYQLIILDVMMPRKGGYVRMSNDIRLYYKEGRS